MGAVVNLAVTHFKRGECTSNAELFASYYTPGAVEMLRDSAALYKFMIHIMCLPRVAAVELVRLVFLSECRKRRHVRRCSFNSVLSSV